METTGWSKRKFDVTAFIEFHTAIGTVLDPTVLLEALLEDDESNPWKMNYNGGVPTRSIEWHSSVRIVESPFEVVRRCTDRMYVIEFRPALMLRGSQLMAYHTYVSNLAGVLARRDLEKVTSVSCRVVVAPVGDVYYTPTVLEKHKKTRQLEVSTVASQIEALLET